MRSLHRRCFHDSGSRCACITDKISVNSFSILKAMMYGKRFTGHNRRSRYMIANCSGFDSILIVADSTSSTNSRPRPSRSFSYPISGTQQVMVSRIRKESSPTQFKCLASRKTVEAGIRFCGFESASEIRSSSSSRCFCVNGGSPSSAMLSQILPTNSNRAVTERFKISGGTLTGFIRTLQTDSAKDGLNRLSVDSRNDNCATTANQEI